MNVNEFKDALVANSDKLVGFVMPDGDAVPLHCHVTEVGVVTKKFIDCGGTYRESASCTLQVWEGNDHEHRLTAGKLAHILELGRKLFPSGALDVEVEYEACSISQYPVSRAEIAADRVLFHLEEKHTDCLAREACGIGDGSEREGCRGKEGCC